MKATASEGIQLLQLIKAAPQTSVQTETSHTNIQGEKTGPAAVWSNDMSPV